MKINVAKNKNIEINIKDGRNLTLLHNIDSCKTINEGNNIIGLDFYGHTYNVGQSIEIVAANTKQLYEINYITKISEYSYELSECKPTKTSTFILPLIAPKNHTYSAFFLNTYFYNAYYKVDGQDMYNDGNHLFLFYRFYNSDYFKELEEYLLSNPNFVKTYEPNRYLTCYIMSIPVGFKEDVNKIIKGKYSKVSTTVKSRIVSFYQAHIESELYHILYRSDKLKLKLEEYLGCKIPDNIELCSKPELIKECYI